jgi:hypothetical protein
LNLFGEFFENRGTAIRTRPKCASTFEAWPIGMSDENRSKLAPALGPAVLRAIGRELRATYADIIAEGVPERFAAILRRLDESTARSK